MTSPAPDTELGWGVGSVAARLGLSPSTLRTWERRYDVGPSRRTAGGHRRYTEIDIDRVLLTQLLIARGAPPSDAARVAHSLDGPGLASALDAENGQADAGTLDPARVVRELLDAAHADDAQRICRLVADALNAQGVVGAWTDVVAPALIAIGEEWSAGRLGIEAEHLASESIVAELRAHTRAAAIVDRAGAAIVLASAEEDPHSLPVFALEAALAETGVGAHVLGAQLPAQSVAAIATRMRPRVVFLWASLPRPEPDPVRQLLDAVGDDTEVLLGGPGWSPEIRQREGGAAESSDLQSTVDRIHALIGHTTALPASNLKA
jgi:MerR family transcriptional regulator, light-induced transcriptional regulator